MSWIITVRCELTKNFTSEETVHHNKISVIGTGSVGMACGINILFKGLSDEVAFVDVDEGKLKGETVDLQHGSSFMKMPNIFSSKDYLVSANSNPVIIIAGACPGKGETCLDVVKRNVSFFKLMIPNITQYSPQCKMIVVSSPVDMLTYVWLYLDTAHFCFFIGQRLGIHSRSCHGWIFGEHGDSSVPVWSGVNIAGIPLKDLNSEIGMDKDPEHWENVPKEVITCGYEMVKMKCYTNWAVGLSVVNLMESILNYLRRVHPISTITKGLYGINEKVFLSVLCILREDGIADVLKINLTPEEAVCLKEFRKALGNTEGDQGLSCLKPPL
uniref:L-lactate dehydrogenase n=1 Tax=Panthera leo TaxID=9689 RepID=A0A8C9CYN2_PANLE